MTEASLKDAIMKSLAKAGGFFWRTGSSPYQKSGCPDILGIYSGSMIAIEVKTPEAYKKKDRGLTKNQVSFLSRLEGNGALVITASSVSQVEGFLEGVKDSLSGPSPSV